MYVQIVDCNKTYILYIYIWKYQNTCIEQYIHIPIHINIYMCVCVCLCQSMPRKRLNYIFACEQITLYIVIRHICNFGAHNVFKGFVQHTSNRGLGDVWVAFFIHQNFRARFYIMPVISF